MVPVPTENQKQFYASAKLTTMVAVNSLQEDEKALRIAEVSLLLANTYLKLAELDWMHDSVMDHKLSEKVTTNMITEELSKLLGEE